jgi:hypothetical protein
MPSMSKPSVAALRISWRGCSSSVTNRVLWPALAAAVRNCTDSTVLPVPEIPLTIVTEPSYGPPSINRSMAGAPSDMRLSEVGWSFCTLGRDCARR